MTRYVHGLTQPRRYLIADVAFTNLVRDMDIQKRCIEIPLDMEQTGIFHTQEWLDNGAYLRVCFLGAGRSVALGIRWEDKYLETSHRDPTAAPVSVRFFRRMSAPRRVDGMNRRASGTELPPGRMPIVGCPHCILSIHCTCFFRGTVISKSSSTCPRCPPTRYGTS